MLVRSREEFETLAVRWARKWVEVRNSKLVSLKFEFDQADAFTDGIDGAAVTGTVIVTCANLVEFRIPLHYVFEDIHAGYLQEADMLNEFRLKDVSEIQLWLRQYYPLDRNKEAAIERLHNIIIQNGWSELCMQPLLFKAINFVACGLNHCIDTASIERLAQHGYQKIVNAVYYIYLHTFLSIGEEVLPESATNGGYHLSPPGLYSHCINEIAILSHFAFTLLMQYDQTSTALDASIDAIATNIGEQYKLPPKSEVIKKLLLMGLIAEGKCNIDGYTEYHFIHPKIHLYYAAKFIADCIRTEIQCRKDYFPQHWDVKYGPLAEFIEKACAMPGLMAAPFSEELIQLIEADLDGRVHRHDANALEYFRKLLHHVRKISLANLARNIEKSFNNNHVFRYQLMRKTLELTIECLESTDTVGLNANARMYAFLSNLADEENTGIEVKVHYEDGAGYKHITVIAPLERQLDDLQQCILNSCAKFPRFSQQHSMFAGQSTINDASPNEDKSIRCVFQ